MFVGAPSVILTFSINSAEQLALYILFCFYAFSDVIHVLNMICWINEFTPELIETKKTLGDNKSGLPFQKPLIDNNTGLLYPKPLSDNNTGLPCPKALSDSNTWLPFYKPLSDNNTGLPKLLTAANFDKKKGRLRPLLTRKNCRRRPLLMRKNCRRRPLLMRKIVNGGHFWRLYYVVLFRYGCRWITLLLLRKKQHYWNIGWVIYFYL